MRTTLTVKSTLSLSYEEVFEFLQRSKTLVRVASPLIQYDGVHTFPKYWQVGDEVNLRPRPFGLLPPTDHWVRFTRIDPTAGILQTQEYGPNIDDWRHTMVVEPLGPQRVRYTDHVTVKANGLVGLFAHVFYRHRHRQWQRSRHRK